MSQEATGIIGLWVTILALGGTMLGFMISGHNRLMTAWRSTSSTGSTRTGTGSPAWRPYLKGLPPSEVRSPGPPALTGRSQELRPDRRRGQIG